MYLRLDSRRCSAQKIRCVLFLSRTTSRLRWGLKKSQSWRVLLYYSWAWPYSCVRRERLFKQPYCWVVQNHWNGESDFYVTVQETLHKTTSINAIKINGFIVQIKLFVSCNTFSSLKKPWGKLGDDRQPIAISRSIVRKQRGLEKLASSSFCFFHLSLTNQSFPYSYIGTQKFIYIMWPSFSSYYIRKISAETSSKLLRCFYRMTPAVVLPESVRVGSDRFWCYVLSAFQYYHNWPILNLHP